MKLNKKRWIIQLLIVLTIPLAFVVISNYTIERYAVDKTYSNVNKLTKNKVGLLLGTSKLLSNGRISSYFQYRVDAAVALYKSGKIEYILVSGDNGSKGYNEPDDFKVALMMEGIPENRIFLDYAGFRTLDSIVRLKKVFGQDSVTIISQQFHNERAIYLASKNNIVAIGFNARDLPFQSGLKVNMREYLARTKVFIDLFFGIEPKHLGDQIEIK